LSTNRRFATMLESRHFPHEFHTVPGGHDWNQWNRNVPALMKSVMSYLKPD
jgi:enterochelin esterase-like enzyme